MLYYREPYSYSFYYQALSRITAKNMTLCLSQMQEFKTDMAVLKTFVY
jgi:hypothetical protein